MGKASRVKRERKELRRDAREALLARVGARIGQTLTRLEPDPSRPKVSASLAEVIDPYIKDGMPLEQFRKCLLLGVIAWNCTVLPEDKAQDLMREVLQETDPSLRQDVQDVVTALRQRKLRLFPEDRRLISDAEGRKQADGTLYITAVAIDPERRGPRPAKET